MTLFVSKTSYLELADVDDDGDDQVGRWYSPYISGELLGSPARPLRSNLLSDPTAIFVTFSSSSLSESGRVSGWVWVLTY